MALNKETAEIVKTLRLNFSKVEPVGKKNTCGWSIKQEKQITENVNRFASAAKKQYAEGDFKNAYLNMRIYAEAKNKLLCNPVDEFDLQDVLYDIDRQMRTTVKPMER